MFSRLPLLFLISLALVSGEVWITSDANVAAFRRVGNLVAGATHAHLSFSFSLSEEERVCQQLLNDTETVASNFSMPMWMPLWSDVQHLAAEWRHLTDSMEASSSLGLGHRHPRQALVAGAAIGAASMWAAYETYTLHQRMTAAEQQVMHLYQAVESSVKLERKVVACVGTLRKAVRSLSNDVISGERFVVEYSAANELRHRLKDRLAGLKALIHQQRLVPELLESSQLEKAFETLRRRAEAAGYEFAVNNILELLGSDVTVILDGDSVVMIVHLLAYPTSVSTAMLFQHLPLPVSGNSSSVLISGEASFLGVFDDGGTFAELATADLEACHRRGQDFYCGAAFPRYRGGESSCLAALYTHNLEVAQRTCSASRLKQETSVYRLNATAFVVAVKNGTLEGAVTCSPSEEPTRVRLSGTVIVALGEGCRLRAGDVEFAALTKHLPEDLFVVVEGPSVGDFENVMTWARKEATEDEKKNADQVKEADLEEVDHHLADLEEDLERNEEPAVSPRWGVSDWVHVLSLPTAALFTLLLTLCTCVVKRQLIASSAAYWLNWPARAGRPAPVRGSPSPVSGVLAGAGVPDLPFVRTRRASPPPPLVHVTVQTENINLVHRASAVEEAVVPISPSRVINRRQSRGLHEFLEDPLALPPDDGVALYLC